VDVNIRTFRFVDDGEIPNNPTLPVIVYERIFRDQPEEMEAAFNRHHWANSWTGDVFDFHHYHSNTHEVLGVKRGRATVLIGGEKGERLELECGDVIVLPAGTGHKKLEIRDDFEVVGAYPDGMHYNLRKRNPEERAQSLSEIESVPVPETDPVFGDEGPLHHKWKK
jgi:uncharacterized protein YjlB